MNRRRYGVAILLAASLLAGCDPDPVEMAAAGAAPVTRIPVGPIPGPGGDPELPPNPLAGSSTALTEGRRLFVRFNCAGCHGGHGGGGMGPSLRDITWRYGNSDAHIFDSIAAGRSMGMPAWGTLLPESEIWKLAAYVQSLNSPSEPSPPTVRVRDVPIEAE